MSSPSAGSPLQEAFFERMGGTQQFRLLFNHLPEVGFFAKDAEGRFVAASPLILHWASCEREIDIIGRHDSRVQAPQTVRIIHHDDAMVMRTGRPLLNRVELLFTAKTGAGWYCTTKLPILDPHGKVIGIMGVTRPYQGSLGHLPQCATLEPVLRYLDEHYMEIIVMAELAKLGGCSERQLNRRFHQVFSMSAQDFIQNRRVHAASAAMQTDAPLAQVAEACGFCDQSHFTRQFRKITGETPVQFRNRLLARNG